MEFPAHGARTNRIEGRVFVSVFEGPINVEMMSGASGLALNDRQALMDSGPWAYLEIYVGSCLATPEALDKMAQDNRDPSRHRNRVAAAIVIGPEVEGAVLAGRVLVRQWDAVPHPVRLFKDERAARDWIDGILAAHDSRNETHTETR